MKWNKNKNGLPEVNFAVEVMLENDEITWDAVQFVNHQYIWEKYQGRIKYWRYASTMDWVMAMRAKNERLSALMPNW